mmetsp:Transcript_37489/g.65552  ORF Transcript_37489/g.65552 Transcript_37489/m.65552 type:complete len:84 (-) Transcript_37489:3521-3772(-)
MLLYLEVCFSTYHVILLRAAHITPPKNTAITTPKNMHNIMFTPWEHIQIFFCKKKNTQHTDCCMFTPSKQLRVFICYQTTATI